MRATPGASSLSLADFSNCRGSTYKHPTRYTAAGGEPVSGKDKWRCLMFLLPVCATLRCCTRRFSFGVGIIRLVA
jgi:hypothetical protein